MNGSRNDCAKRLMSSYGIIWQKNATTLKKYYLKFITHKEMDQRSQEKVFSPTKGLVIFFQLFKRKKLINVIFMLPKGDLQELLGLGQNKELIDQNMPLMEINPR